MKTYNKPKLTKHGHIRNITFSRDSDTWEHNTPVTPGYITDVGTGKKTPIPKDFKR